MLRHLFQTRPGCKNALDRFFEYALEALADTSNAVILIEVVTRGAAQVLPSFLIGQKAAYHSDQFFQPRRNLPETIHGNNAIWVKCCDHRDAETPSLEEGGWKSLQLRGAT